MNIKQDVEALIAATKTLLGKDCHEGLDEMFSGFLYGGELEHKLWGIT